MRYTVVRTTESLSTEERDRLQSDLPGFSYQTCVPSVKHPSHLFNRRYLRSSYNDGGLNYVVRDLVGEDHGLYWIFEPLGREWDGDEGALTISDVPALIQCHSRANQLARELNESNRPRVMDAAPVLGTHHHMWADLPTQDQVLEWYCAERDAITVGRNALGNPAVVIVYQQSDEEREWYVRAAGNCRVLRRGNAAD